MTPIQAGDLLPGALRPGDVLLYRPSGFLGYLFGIVIFIKTWHWISHVETYVGNGQSVASRDGKGTGKYPLRLRGLTIVCRPKEAHPFNVAKALDWFNAQPHLPYGWTELLNFTGLPVDGKGIVCSAQATVFSRAGDLDPFNAENERKIAPFQFRVSVVYDLFKVIGKPPIQVMVPRPVWVAQEEAAEKQEDAGV